MAHILVIDDDAAVRSLTSDALRRVGHHVSEAGDGKEGLSKFRTDGADLVITDLVMPTNEGIETIMELRRDFPEAKIIAMSGALHSKDYLQLAGRLGALRTLDKPFTTDRLLSVVATALE
jgi:DNA-binding NtrC family response regulator